MSNPCPENRRPPLVVVGGLHVDELVWPTGSLVARASNPVRRERRAGGVGANVARAAARHGGRAVVLVAALGDDEDGERLAGDLAARGVEVRARVMPGRASGRYTAVHDERGELFVGLADTGIAEALDAAAVRERLGDRTGDPLDEARVAALVLDANLDAACLGELVAGAAGGGCPVVALAVSPGKSRRLAPSLAALDLLFCNRREAAALGGIDADGPIGRLGDALTAAGCERVVLSDGADPVLVHTPDGRTSVDVPPAVVAGSVNGAGDALAGATLARWLAHGDLAVAVRDAGLPAAAAVVSEPGTPRPADTALPTPPEKTP